MEEKAGGRGGLERRGARGVRVGERRALWGEGGERMSLKANSALRSPASLCKEQHSSPPTTPSSPSPPRLLPAVPKRKLYAPPSLKTKPRRPRTLTSAATSTLSTGGPSVSSNPAMVRSGAENSSRRSAAVTAPMGRLPTYSSRCLRPAAGGAPEGRVRPIRPDIPPAVAQPAAPPKVAPAAAAKLEAAARAAAAAAAGSRVPM
eukprot:scaffold9953_cov70-Isochrysis_galbana.AAC.2